MEIFSFGVRLTIVKKAKSITTTIRNVIKESSLSFPILGFPGGA